MKKSQKGFTLVELVVVIAIIGVLAAILVPSMLNYVKKSRLKTANSNAKTAYNAASEYTADQETKGNGLTTAMANFSGSFVLATGASSDGDVVVGDALKSNGDESGGFVVFLATLKNGEKDQLVVQWAKTDSDEMIGQYPDAVEWDNWKDNAPFTLGTYISPV
jgi:type IV pilus assembly protein PilA